MSQQVFNMDQTNFAAESLKSTIVTVDAMKQATKDLKQTQKKLNIDKIEVTFVFISDVAWWNGRFIRRCFFDSRCFG